MIKHVFFSFRKLRQKVLLFRHIYILLKVLATPTLFIKRMFLILSLQKKHIRGVTISYYFSSQERGKVTPFKDI